MNNLNSNLRYEIENSQEVYAARIGLIGNALSTLGDALQTIAAGIELQQLESENLQNRDTQTRPAELIAMQKQINELKKQIENMERKQSL